jgi:hypothetical protein
MPHQASTGAGRGFAYRGVAYDSGSNFATGQGDLSRNVWSTPRMQGEISAISDQLNCNSITIYGTDLGRLSDTATAAVERGMHVWLQPQLVDRPQSEVLDHLAEAARLAESLRQQGASINLTVGAAHLVFLPDIIAGDYYHERMANIYADANHYLLTPTAKVDVPAAAPALNDFLSRAATVARGIFNDGISYASGPFEDVDWRLFDFVGLNYYYLPKYQTPAEHLALLGRYQRWNKPVVITGFGTASYQGAEQKAFFAWDVVNRSGDELTIVDGCVRDEGAQAAYHRKMFDIFGQAGVHGVAVMEFIHPTHPHSTDPRLDLDMASMCIVKTIREVPADPDSPYRWEPSEAFHAIGDYYAEVGARKAIPA